MKESVEPSKEFWRVLPHGTRNPMEAMCRDEWGFGVRRFLSPPIEAEGSARVVRHARVTHLIEACAALAAK